MTENIWLKYIAKNIGLKYIPEIYAEILITPS